MRNVAYDAIVSELTAVSEAVEAGDLAKLDGALTRLNDTYDSVRADERSRVARLQAARTDADLSAEQHEVVATYERWFMTTYFGRGSLLAAGDLYLLDPEEADVDEIRSQASELATRENGLKETTSETDDVLEAADVPPRLGVLSFSAADSPSFGDDVRVELVLENVGDGTASGVTATLTSDALDVEELVRIGTIPPGERRTTTFDANASAGGTVVLEVSIESDDAGSVTETETITVLTKRSVVETVLGTLETLRERVEQSDATKKTTRSVTAKIDAALRSANRALEEIDRGRSKQANKAINTTINQLGALLNSLAGDESETEKGRGGTKNFDPALRTALVNQTELAIDHLTDARKTDIQR